MADIRDLWLSRHLESEVNLRTRIILAILKEAVIEEFARVSLDIVLSMLTTVNVTTVIADPNVVALVGEHEAGRICSVLDPCVRITEEAMLQEDRLSADLHIFPVHAEQSYDVAIRCFHLVLLAVEIFLLCYQVARAELHFAPLKWLSC